MYVTLVPWPAFISAAWQKYGRWVNIIEPVSARTPVDSPPGKPPQRTTTVSLSEVLFPSPHYRTDCTRPRPRRRRGPPDKPVGVTFA